MTIETIKANNLLAGQFFFSKDSMRFFKSRVLPTVYGGRYFITREVNPSGKVAYTVREAVDGGKHIKTIGDFHMMDLKEAKSMARAMAVSTVGAI